MKRIKESAQDEELKSFHPKKARDQQRYGKEYPKRHALSAGKLYLEQIKISSLIAVTRRAQH